MANRIFVSSVIILWLGSMTWLMIDKILPSIHEGEPPLAAGYQDNVPVGWRVYWGDRPVGRAASVRTPGVLNTTNIHNRVVLEDVPLLDLLPPLMRRVVGNIGPMRFDAATRLEFDSLDNFTRFKSRVALNDVSPALDLSGQVNGAFLELKVHFGEVFYEPRAPIGDAGALNEALLPDATLPYLYVGRRWTEEVYNPFRAPSAPVETVDVEVTGIETIKFGEQNHRTMRVEFYGPPAPGVPEDARLQAIAWVRGSDGMVLQQDVIISTARLRFVRMTDEEAAVAGRELLSVGSLAPDWHRRFDGPPRRHRQRPYPWRADSPAGAGTDAAGGHRPGRRPPRSLGPAEWSERRSEIDPSIGAATPAASSAASVNAGRPHE